VLIGPEEPIILPQIVHEYGFKEIRTDLEAELAVIIKNRCKNVSEHEALKHVYGYTCMNDVSQRNIQKGDKTGWFRGNSFDTFGPIGPTVVLAEDMKSPHGLEIQSRLNGKICQSANTRMMIFKIDQIIAFISRNFTLEPGDIISTGTPKGVTPIHDGDIVEIEIESIGILRNPVKQTI
jgi:2-keto-4-pentenoate hydratase/2-oxohepta-3-ene-1,7-dioic acid hydratase in catechol pathway